MGFAIGNIMGVPGFLMSRQVCDESSETEEAVKEDPWRCGVDGTVSRDRRWSRRTSRERHGRAQSAVALGRFDHPAESLAEHTIAAIAHAHTPPRDCSSQGQGPQECAVYKSAGAEHLYAMITRRGK